MEGFYALLAIVLWILLGVFVTSFSRQENPDERPFFVQLPWFFGMGSALGAYTWFLMNVAGFPIRRFWICAAGWAVLVGAWVRLRGRRRSPPVCREAFHPTEMAWLSLIGLMAFLSLWQAALPMYMWDGIVMYAYKAKILFQEGTFRTRAFSDPTVYHINADYPLLLPYIEASYFILLGQTNDRWVRLIFLTYWLGWLGLIWDGLRGHWPRRWALAAVAFLASLPLFFEEFMGQAASGFADIPLAFYWTGFLIKVVRWRKKPVPADAWLMVAFAIGCVFTKVEGGMLVALTGLVLLVREPGLLRRLWPGIVGLGVILFPWYAVRHGLPHNAAHYARLPSLDWHEGIARTMVLGRYIGREMAGVGHWGFFWPVTLFGLAWRQHERVDLSGSKMIARILILQGLLYLGVFCIYPGSLEMLLPTTVRRLLIHFLGPLALAAAWRWPSKQPGSS